MEKKKTIEDVLENSAGNIILKRKKSMLPSILTLTAGILFFVFQAAFQWDINSIYPHLFLALGGTLVIVGAVMFFVRTPHFIVADTGLVLVPTEIYFDAGDFERLTRLVEQRKFEDLKNLKLSTNNNLKIRFLSTADGEFCYSQIQKYVPFEYANINDPMQNTSAEAKTLKELGKIKL